MRVKVFCLWIMWHQEVSPIEEEKGYERKVQRGRLLSGSIQINWHKEERAQKSNGLGGQQKRTN